ncbi:MAG: DNA/RNA non-specific endonuclease [Janthinobacterium sp.]|jgi:endonuclease G
MRSKVLFVLSLLFHLALASFGQETQLLIASTKDKLCIGNLEFESRQGDSLLNYVGYSVLFSFTRKLPLFTFNTIFPNQLNNDGRIPARRSNRFIPVKLPNGMYSATNVDYQGSGYDRGHMVPAGDFTWNQTLKDETFLYTNINPQSPNLNRGIWANLEDAIRKTVQQKQEHAHVVTGVVFEKKFTKKIGPDGMQVPFAFFKISYFPASKQMFAFLFDNTVEYYNGVLTDFQVPVDFIEAITGEDFFAKLPDHLEKNLESTIDRFKYANEK